MIRRTLALALVAVAALAAPAARAEQKQPVVEMVFALDTTGSMGSLIDGAKRRIWGIVNEIMKSPCRPAVRVGLVVYRDRGDEYVTKVLALTSDLDLVYTTLMEARADGGGDWPEDVRSALRDAVEKAGWAAPAPGLTQVIFLVGDAPPHYNYSDVPDTTETASRAASRGIVVHAIECGDDVGTRQSWEAIAQRGGGRYFAVPQDGAVAVVERTPYDAPLAELGRKLGDTYVPYGTAEEQAANDARQAALERRVAHTAPRSAAADRAVNKAINEEAYVGDLLQSIENGETTIDAVPRDRLPADLRDLSPEELRREIARRLERRRHLRAAILDIATLRDEFIEEGRRKAGDPSEGFDRAVGDAVKDQLAKRGADCR